MDDRPQTNLQLLNQLRRKGYEDGDVARVKSAYDFVAAHFSGWFRASGKPFLAHLVGTAGILCAAGARPAAIVAGLSHAIYELGELPARTGGTRAMRARVREALGIESEELIARYAALEWSVSVLPQLRARLPTMSETERDAVLVRLANELDDHLDLAPLYCANAEERRRRIDGGLRIAVDIAADLGAGELAASLRRAFDATQDAELPRELRTDHTTSFSLPTTSMWRRHAARLRRLVATFASAGAARPGESA
jgi:(p)ppGpp synthase/HD superfamily hydrolase